jgi:hypothetical protein
MRWNAIRWGSDGADRIHGGVTEATTEADIAAIKIFAMLI